VLAQARGTSIRGLIAALEIAVMPRFRWVKGFLTKPRGSVHMVYMLGTETPLLPFEPGITSPATASEAEPKPGATTEPVPSTTPGTGEPPVQSYGDMAGTLEPGFQANHLNQNAAFRDVIPRDEGVVVAMRGNAFTEPGTPHYEFHRSLEQFWDQFRPPGGARIGELPTNAEYGAALQNALHAGSVSPSEAARLADAARAHRVVYGLTDDLPVPRIPGKLRQTPPP